MIKIAEIMDYVIYKGINIANDLYSIEDEGEANEYLAKLDDMDMYSYLIVLEDMMYDINKSYMDTDMRVKTIYAGIVAKASKSHDSYTTLDIEMPNGDIDGELSRRVKEENRKLEEDENYPSQKSYLKHFKEIANETVEVLWRNKDNQNKFPHEFVLDDKTKDELLNIRKKYND